MKLAIAGDSTGEALAKELASYLGDRFDVYEVSKQNEAADAFYADLSDRVASQVADGTYDKAILVCVTGIGVCISANKVPGIRAALTHDTFSAERAALSIMAITPVFRRCRDYLSLFMGYRFDE